MSGRKLRRPWHTLVTWHGGVGVILVRGGYVPRTLERRRDIAHKLAVWAWGALPGEWRPAPSPDTRERGAALEPFREAG